MKQKKSIKKFPRLTSEEIEMLGKGHAHSTKKGKRGYDRKRSRKVKDEY